MNKHMYPFKNLLNPEGVSLSNTSIGVLLVNKITPIMKSWLDPAYSDVVTPDEFMTKVKQSLMSECTDALEFIEETINGLKEAQECAENTEELKNEL